MSRPLAALLLVLAAAAARGGEPPLVEHHPVPCTIPGKPISLCATITDDGQVAKARGYFRPAGEKLYSFVDMTFGGIQFCATLPAPREGKLKSIEYYVQGIDDEYDSKRTSTYQMSVLPDGMCEFPPVERDPSRAASIVVYATSPKQGKKLPDEFATAGVSFVAAKNR
jgi:hypothetical protein